MLLRGSVRNNPRVRKEAETLANSGCRLTIVAAKMPNEADAVERFGRKLIVLRTTTAFLTRLRSIISRPLQRSSVRVPAPDGGAGRLGYGRVSLLLISRALLAIKMAALVLRTRPNAVHAHDFSTLPAAWLATRVRRVPLVYDAHEVNLSREGYYRQLVALIAVMEGYLIRRCDHVITTTELRARHFRRVYGLRTTPTVLQNRPPYAAAIRSDMLRETLSIPRQALLCIYQGGLQEGRGLQNLIRATSQVDGVHLVLLGGGHQEAALRRLVRELGAGDRIHFHPRVPLLEVPHLTASADVGLQVLRNTCFNHWSTDSNKLFEYALAGLAVIASDFPEIRRVVRAHEFGVLVDPHSVGAIAQALMTLRDDRVLLDRLQQSALASARGLSWESQEPALFAAYQLIGIVGVCENRVCAS